jgi:ATP synthase protein I
VFIPKQQTSAGIARGVLPSHPQVWDDVQLRPYRIVIRWQVAATVVMALLGGLLDGRHGAISALLGGAVVSTAAALSMLVASYGARVSASPGGALLALLRAEAVKVAAIVLLLWVVFSSYKDVVVVGFIGSFVVSLGILGMAILVRESKHDEARFKNE